MPRHLILELRLLDHDQFVVDITLRLFFEGLAGSDANLSLVGMPPRLQIEIVNRREPSCVTRVLEKQSITIWFLLSSSKCSSECSYVFKQQIGLFHRSKVTTAGHFRPMLNVVDPFNI